MVVLHARMIYLICMLENCQQVWVYKSVGHVIKLLYNKQGYFKSFYPIVLSIFLALFLIFGVCLHRNTYIYFRALIILIAFIICFIATGDVIKFLLFILYYNNINGINNTVVLYICISENSRLLA